MSDRVKVALCFSVATVVFDVASIFVCEWMFVTLAYTFLICATKEMFFT